MASAYIGTVGGFPSSLFIRSESDPLVLRGRVVSGRDVSEKKNAAKKQLPVGKAYVYTQIHATCRVDWLVPAAWPTATKGAATFKAV